MRIFCQNCIKWFNAFRLDPKRFQAMIEASASAPAASECRIRQAGFGRSLLRPIGKPLLVSTLMALLIALSFASAQAEDLVCAAPAKAMMRAELMFGRKIGGRLGVTDVRWRQFVAQELTPRFPDGLTVIDAQGQWRDPRGALVREPSKIVVIVTIDDTGAREKLSAVAAAYKERFRQQSVGVVTHPVCAAF